LPRSTDNCPDSQTQSDRYVYPTNLEAAQKPIELPHPTTVASVLGGRIGRLDDPPSSAGARSGLASFPADSNSALTPTTPEVAGLKLAP
jgi:hypothetical protein